MSLPIPSKVYFTQIILFAPFTVSTLTNEIFGDEEKMCLNKIAKVKGW